METNYQKLIAKVPKEVTYVTETLEKGGFSAYLVGGCVRDLMMSQILRGVEGGREPKDWDITTDAKPEQIIGLFEKTVYENTFGTVGVVVNHETPESMIIEVTPYRLEGKYSDNRHPDEVMFSVKLEDDLKRRDFTVNAMALGKGPAQSLKDIESGWHLTDMYDGLSDIEKKVLRTVGEPDERFGEDALRMLRAVRFACQLNFSISTDTMNSIIKNADLIKNISQERIRDEFVKIILSPSPSVGIDMLQKFGLLKYIIPELEEGIKCEQGGAHKYDVYEHLLQALQHSADKNWSLEIRLSALFHDIGKPKTRRIAGPVDNFTGPRFSSPQIRGARPDHVKSSSRPAIRPYTFYGHEVVGARMAKKIMERMKFSRDEINFVESMVRNHMFFSDTEQITLSAVRRIIVKVSPENIWNLMNVREADRVGMAKKEAPYRLRKYHAMIEECLRDPISVSQLKIDGNFLMNDMNIKPGPRMGWMLNALLEEVLENPEKNEIEYLKNRVLELEKLSDADLRALGEKAKEKKEELEDIEVSKLHEKHGVKK